MQNVEANWGRGIVGLAIGGLLAVSLSSAPVLAAKKAPPASAAGAPLALAKSYTGSAHNVTASVSGVLTLTDVTQHGAAIAGTLALHAPLAGTGPFRGTVSPSAVTFTVSPTAASCPSCVSIVFKGKVWPIGSMSGTWVARLKSGGSQQGTWGLGSTWNGTLHSITADKTQGMGIGALTEGANGVLVGTLVIYGSAFAGGVATLTGSVRGSVVRFTSAIGNNEFNHYDFTFVGTLSPSGGISGTWSFPYNGWSGSPQKGVWQVQRSGTQAPV